MLDYGHTLLDFIYHQASTSFDSLKTVKLSSDFHTLTLTFYNSESSKVYITGTSSHIQNLGVLGVFVTVEYCFFVISMSLGVYIKSY